MAASEGRVVPTRAIVNQGRARRLALITPLLSSGGFLALMYTAVSPILSEMATHLGNGSNAALSAQLFMTTPSIGMMAGGLASAWLVGRMGARRLLLTALAVYGAAGSAGALLDDLGPLLASRLLLGLAAAGIATGATTLLAERFDADARSRLIGYQSSIGAASGLVSTLLAGIAAELAGWRSPFGFYLLAWAMWVVAAWGHPSAEPKATVASNAVLHARVPWHRLWPLYVLCVPLYAAIFMTTTQVPFLLRDDGVVSPSVQSWVLAMASMWNAIGSALYGRVRDCIGASKTFSVSLALMAVGQALLGLSHIPVLTAIGCAVAGSGAGLAVPHVPGMVIGRVDGIARGKALGLMYSCLFLGSFSNPLFIAPVTAMVGRHGALLVSAALLAAASVWAARVARHRSKGA